MYVFDTNGETCDILYGHDVIATVDKRETAILLCQELNKHLRQVNQLKIRLIEIGHALDNERANSYPNSTRLSGGAWRCKNGHNNDYSATICCDCNEAR